MVSLPHLSILLPHWDKERDLSSLSCFQASNLKAAFMHLTNYAVNKHNESFVSGPEADSSKWDFATLR